MTVAYRDVARKSQSADARVPVWERRSVRRHEGVELLLTEDPRWEEAFYKQVQALHHRLADMRLAKQFQQRRQLHAIGDDECPCIEDDQSLDAVGVLDGISQPDWSAPILHHERDVAQIE